MKHADHGRLIFVITVLWFLVGCSNRTPTSPRTTPPATLDSGLVVTNVLPVATGSVRRLADLGVIQKVTNDSSPRASYIHSATYPREFCRSLAEFDVPSFTRVEAASIAFETGWRWAPAGATPPRYDVSAYGDVDLAVDVTDFGRAATSLGDFDVGGRFDLPGLFTAGQSVRIGFRVRSTRDPVETRMLSEGVYFLSPTGIRLEFVTSASDAASNLVRVVRGLGLANEVESRLLVPLLQAEAVLVDSDPDNDADACVALNTFLSEVGRDAGPQAELLRTLGFNLRFGLRCNRRPS